MNNYFMNTWTLRINLIIVMRLKKEKMKRVPINRDEFPDTSGPKQEIPPNADKYKHMKGSLISLL